MEFLVPNYSCLQNPWLRGYRPQIPVLSVLCSQLNLLNPPPPPRKKILGYATEFGWLRETQSQFLFLNHYMNEDLSSRSFSLCISVHGYHRFGEIFYLHLWGGGVYKVEAEGYSNNTCSGQTRLYFLYMKHTPWLSTVNNWKVNTHTHTHTHTPDLPTIPENCVNPPTFHATLNPTSIFRNVFNVHKISEDFVLLLQHKFYQKRELKFEVLIGNTSGYIDTMIHWYR